VQNERRHCEGTVSTRTVVYLGLGSNLGDREEQLNRAIELLAAKLDLEMTSSTYETEPVGYVEQPRFLNLVCRGYTELTPGQLLRLAKDIESEMGRVPSFRDASRPIDIDILFYDDEIIKTHNLTIPHPRLAERAFVLIPLAEIAPEMMHPGLKRSIGEMAATVDGRDGVRRIAGGPDVSAVRGRAL